MSAANSQSRRSGKFREFCIKFRFETNRPEIPYLPFPEFLSVGILLLREIIVSPDSQQARRLFQGSNELVLRIAPDLDVELTVCCLNRMRQPTIPENSPGM